MSPETNTTPTPAPVPINPQTYSMQQPVAPVEPKSKKIWFIIAGAILAVVLIVGGLWFWSRSAANQFVSAVPGYESRSKEAYGYFLGLSDRLSHGKEINDKFSQTIASAPKEPKLLGMSLAPADKAKRVSDLTAAMEKFKTTYVAAADVSTYSEKTLNTMASVSGTINSPDAMKVMSPKLTLARTTIAALKRPEVAASFHTSLMTKYDTAIKDLNDAIKAYDSGKSDEYSALVQKLPADMKALSTNGARDELAQIFNTAYGQADSAFGDLQKLLGIDS